MENIDKYSLNIFANTVLTADSIVSFFKNKSISEFSPFTAGIFKKKASFSFKLDYNGRQLHTLKKIRIPFALAFI